MTDVSRETEDMLSAYERLATKWNARINLVSSSTIGDFRSRHIDDCLQLPDHCGHPTGSWVDLGSGGGLPGIVLAIAFRHQPLTVKLVESDHRKCAFLRTVIRDLGLSKATVLTHRIEDVPPLSADHLSARALAPMSQLLGMVRRHMAPQGTAWLMKGRSWRQECAQAAVDWRFDFEPFQSRTDPDAALLKVTGVSHA